MIIDDFSKPKLTVVEGSAANDYFTRRKSEEDRIAGVKAPAKNKKNPANTDYAKKRKQQDIEESRPFRGTGGAFNRGDDERHDLDPTDWYKVKDGKMFRVSIYPRQVAQAEREGYSRTQAEAKAAAGSQGVAKGRQIDEVFADQGSGSTAKDNAEYMKRRKAAKFNKSAKPSKPKNQQEYDAIEKYRKDLAQTYNKPKKEQGVAEGLGDHRALGKHHEEMTDRELRKVGNKLPDAWDAAVFRRKLASHPKYAQALKHYDKSEYHFGKAARQGVAEGIWERHNSIPELEDAIKNLIDAYKGGVNLTDKGRAQLLLSINKGKRILAKKKQQQQGMAEGYPKHQDLSGISTDKLKAYLDKQSKQQVSGEGNQVKRVRAELQRREQSLSENAEDLHIGDPVIITGNGIKFEGATGEIVDFGRDNRFVVVNLYNHGRHSFHSSDVSFNEYAGSDDEEARMYDAGEFGDDYRNEMDEARMSAAQRLSNAWDRQRAKSDASLRRTPSSIPKTVDKERIIRDIATSNASPEHKKVAIDAVMKTMSESRAGRQALMAQMLNSR